MDTPAKQPPLLIALLTTFALAAYGQDSTDSARLKFGVRVGIELGTFSNSRLAGMESTLRQLNVDTRSVGPLPVNGIIALVLDHQSSTSELRYIRPFSSHTDTPEVVLSPTRRAKFYGHGLGGSFTIKLISTRHFILGPLIGYDLIWYRLDLLPVEQKNVAIVNVVNNPTGYLTNTLKQDANGNLHIAINGEVRFRWQREFRFGTRIGYQFPITSSNYWSLNDGYVGDLPAFRSNMLYVQINGCLF